jgi:hypothetical protein
VSRRPKDLGSYPQIYFEIASRAHQGQTIPQMRMLDRKAAVATAHDFNRFKQVLARERHPHFEATLDLMCRVTNLNPPGYPGDYVLDFVPRGLYRLADAMKGKNVGVPEKDGLPDLEPSGTPEGVEKFISAVKLPTPREQFVEEDDAFTKLLKEKYLKKEDKP